MMHIGHHPKLDQPSGHAALIARLQSAWRLRFQLGHTEGDPLTEGERLLADLRLTTKREDARKWIADLRAEQRAAAKQRSRRGLLMISGGRR